MRRIIGVLFLGCVSVFGLASLSGGTAGTAVNLPAVLENLLTIPTETSDSEWLAGSEADGADDLNLLPGGEDNDLFEVGMLVVLVLWLLGAAKSMRAGAAVLCALACVILAALFVRLSFGGSVAGTAIGGPEPGASLFHGIVIGLLAFVVLVTGATMFVPVAIDSPDSVPLLAMMSAAVRDRLERVRATAENTGNGPAIDNDVYRSWVAFVDRVGVDEATSPAEAAREAKKAGLPPDAVEAIRETFEEVRYGTAETTESRSERMRAALDQLEPNPEFAENDGGATVSGSIDGTGGDG